VLYDADNQGYPYLKRFLMEASKRKQNYLGDNPNSQQLLLTDTPYPRLLMTYGGNDAFRGSEEIDAEQFIAVKGYKAKGKRLTTLQLDAITELEPLRQPEPDATDVTASVSSASVSGTLSDSLSPSAAEPENLDPDAGKSQQQVLDELTGQLRLFPDEDA
jgi:topoisomerase-4 subunit A